MGDTSCAVPRVKFSLENLKPRHCCIQAIAKPILAKLRFEIFL